MHRSGPEWFQTEDASPGCWPRSPTRPPPKHLQAERKPPATNEARTSKRYLSPDAGLYLLTHAPGDRIRELWCYRLPGAQGVSFRPVIFATSVSMVNRSGLAVKADGTPSNWI